MPETREQNKITAGRLAAYIAAALAAVFLGFCVAAAARESVAPRTAVGGVEVGGLTRAAAARAIAAALDDLRGGAGVRATLADGTDAAYLSYAALDADFDANALADAAYRRCHSGNPLADGWALLCAVCGQRAALAPEPTDGWARAAAPRLAAAAAAEKVDFAYALDGHTLRLTRARDGRAVDVDELEARLAASRADASGARTVELPYTTVPADAGDLDAVQAALGGETMSARRDAGSEFVVSEREPVRFDAARARARLDAAAPGETVALPVTRVLPAATERFPDVLSVCVTAIAGDAGHNANVRLTAARVNNVVLRSGEKFSYCAHTAPFTAANGYQPAAGYLNGKTVEMYGGGACQCSSTLYAAALLADLEIVSRTAHGFTVDYVPPGLDATVSGDGPDFVFRNDTAYPIQIQALCDADRLTVAILGTKTDDTTVRIRREIVSVTPYEEQVVEDPTLAPGERVADVTPFEGCTVKTYRRRCAADGAPLSERLEATSRYKKRDAVIRVAPAPDAP